MGNEMVIGKIKTYQQSFLIVAGSLLALLVLIAVTGTSGGQHLQSSANEIAEDAVALADYQADSAISALTKDIFGLNSVSENDEGLCCRCHRGVWCRCGYCGCDKNSPKFHKFNCGVDLSCRYGNC